MFYLEDLDGRSRAYRFLGDAAAGDMVAWFIYCPKSPERKTTTHWMRPVRPDVAPAARADASIVNVSM
jgi:hypothetical protein